MNFAEDNDYPSPRVHEAEYEILLKQLQLKIREARLPFSIVPRTDPAFLSKFIRTKDYDIDAAFEAFVNYYNGVVRNLDFIDGARPSLYKTAFMSETVVVFKNRFKGSRVAMLRVKNWNAKEVQVKELEMLSLILAEDCVNREVETNEKGIIVIFDLEGLTFDQLRRLSVREVRRIIQTVQEGVPVRVAGVHFLNPPTMFWALFKIVMKLLKEKIRKRVHLHYSHESLHKCLGRDIMPESLGGHLPESEYIDIKVIEDLLNNDIPYEANWNGAYGKSRPERRLTRKRSSNGELLCSY